MLANVYFVLLIRPRQTCPYLPGAGNRGVGTQFAQSFHHLWHGKQQRRSPAMSGNRPKAQGLGEPAVSPQILPEINQPLLHPGGRETT